jgi:DNA-directed RNA polymerase specialized sigma24 family protein
MEERKNEKFIFVNVQHVPIEEHEDSFSPSYDFNVDFENKVFALTSYKEVAVLLLRYMGYSYLEVVEILGLKDTAEYYKIYRKLRENIKKSSN